MRNMNHITDRTEQLRGDPDFRALVRLLKNQSPEGLEAFCDEYGEHDERASCEECDERYREVSYEHAED